MLNIIAWILVGLFAGMFTGVMLPKNNLPILDGLFFGSLGAVANGFLASSLMGASLLDWNRAALMVALLGSLSTVALLHNLPRRSQGL